MRRPPRRAGARRSPRRLGRRCPACARRSADLRAPVQRGATPRSGDLPGRRVGRLRRCDAARADQGRHAAPLAVRSMASSASARCAPLGVVGAGARGADGAAGFIYEKDGATLVPFRGLSATRRTASCSAATASSPTSPPTSATTARSCSAATTSSSTSGAPTTTATSSASRRRSRRSAAIDQKLHVILLVQLVRLTRGGEPVRMGEAHRRVRHPARSRRRGRRRTRRASSS
mgnify:CR=1 FL=1